MISLKSTRDLIEETIFNAIEQKFKVFREFAPIGEELGIVCHFSDLAILDRTIDKTPSSYELKVKILAFSFASRQKTDEIADVVISAIDAKSSSDFQLITVDEVENMEYDKDSGVYATLITSKFII